MQAQMQNTTVLPDGSKIKVTENNDSVEIFIPQAGFKGKGLVTLLVIGAWLFTILIFSVILMMMKPLYALYSIPFWIIGIHTLIKAVNILRIGQKLTIQQNSIKLRLTQGDRFDEKTFIWKDSTINLVEGSYNSYSGLSRRGQFPAIIFNNESFSFAERCTAAEKTWLINYINNYYKN